MKEEEAKKISFNPRGGRPKLSDDLALIHRVNWRLNKEEFNQLKEAFEDSGLKDMTEYLRERLIHTKYLYVHNPKEIIRSMDAIGTEIGRIGNNINQLAKYANILTKEAKYNEGIIEELNVLLRSYGKERKELALAIRALMRRR